MEELLAEFATVTKIQVAWGEMDALQHVNNAVYFRYFETARLDYFNKINLLVNLKQNHIGPVLSHTECRYKAPVTYPDTLLIGSRVTDLQDDRFTMEYQIVSENTGKVATVGSATCVMFDFKQHTKASIPENIKQAILLAEER